MLTSGEKAPADCRNRSRRSDHNGFCQLIVNGIAAVLDGNDTGALLTGDDGDGFAAVASQREQECVQFLIIGFDPLNDVFFAFCGGK